MSVYGCTEEWDIPSDSNSLIPGDSALYNASSLGFDKLPSPYNIELEMPGCNPDDSYVGPMPEDLVRIWRLFVEIDWKFKSYFCRQILNHEFLKSSS